MADEFVQKVKITVDDSELVAAVKRFREAFGGGVAGVGGNNPASGLEKGMEKAGKAAGETARQAQNIAKATKDATRETNGLTSAFDRMKGAVTGLVAAYAGFKGISALVGFGKGSVDAFVSQRKQEQMLDTVLRNNGMGQASKYIKLQASRIQQLTTIGDESMIAGAAELSTYIKDPKRLSRMMNLLADYSMGMTGGAEMNPQMLTNLATGLGKAFDGTYDSLRKKGFDTSELEMITNALKLNEDLKKGNVKTDKKTGELKLSADEKELLKWLKEHRGQNVEDLKVAALERALKDWKGLAEEFAKTDEGKIQQLKNTIGDMKEDIGGELLPVVAELASTMKANLPVLRKMFEGFRDILLSLLETMKSHTGEIRFFADAMSDTLKIFAKAPVEIVAFAGAMKTIGPAMGAAKMSALEAGAAFNVMGKAMRGILKGGLMALTIWSIGKIAELAKAGKEYVGSELDRIHREDYAREGGEAMTRVRGLQGQQKKLGLTEEQIAAARAKMRNVPAGFDFRNVRDPAVARMFEGLDKKQMDWMSLEFEKRSWRAKADAAYAKMNEVGKNEVVPDSSIDLKKELDIEMAKLTKGDTYNNNITVNNSITTDSDMTAKIIKEQLRVFATSQLNFTSRTAAAKALAL